MHVCWLEQKSFISVQTSAWGVSSLLFACEFRFNWQVSALCCTQSLPEYDHLLVCVSVKFSPSYSSISTTQNPLQQKQIRISVSEQFLDHMISEWLHEESLGCNRAEFKIFLLQHCPVNFSCKSWSLKCPNHFWAPLEQSCGVDCLRIQTAAACVSEPQLDLS